GRFRGGRRGGRSGHGHADPVDRPKLPREVQIVRQGTHFEGQQVIPGAAGRMAGRFSQFAVAAAKMAREDAHLDTAQIPSERILVSVGSSMSGLIDVQDNFVPYLRGEIIPPWMVLEYPGHAAASHVAIHAKGHGQVSSFGTACVAGLDSVAWAAEKIRRGD